MRILHSTEAGLWNAFVQSHTNATLYHLFGWKHVIEKTYGHKAYYLTALKDAAASHFQTGAVSGILPLVHLKHFFFGNNLASMPFFDMGGVLADEAGAEESLVAEAVRLGKKLKVDTIELRHRTSAPCPQSGPPSTHKVRMLLDLPNSSEALMKGFKSKLRSQIKKAVKDGLRAEIGGAELINDFYRVFLVNMRDLGSPVHSKRLIENVFKHFPNDARVVVVRYQKQAVAGSVMVGFEEVLENPWASSLRRFSHLNANMLLYWTMLEHACHRGYQRFDFGRSTPGEGTYNFKAQWGARPEPLNWVSIPLKGQKVDRSIAENKKFQLAAAIWKKLPVPVTRLLGPRMRKHISL